MLKRKPVCLAAALFVCLMATPKSQAADAESLMPAVPFGGITAVPDAHNVADPAKTYKAIIDLPTKSGSPDKANEQLVKVGRLVNLFASAEVPQDHRKFVVVVHEAATPIVLNDEEYAKRFGTKNPNLPLIAALEKTGVEIHVCGQALALAKFEDAWVDDSVEIDLGAYMTVIVLTSQGYSHLIY